MRKDLEERYKIALITENTSKDLAEMVMKRDDRICEFRAWINQILAGGQGYTLVKCIDKLEKLKEVELSQELQGVLNYLTTGNEFLNDMTKK